MNYAIKSERDILKLELKLAQLKAQKERYETQNRIEFWKPWLHQQKALDFIHSGKSTVLIQGSNRIGKTVFGVCVLGSGCLGYQPWNGAASVWGNQPIRCRIICVDWEHHAQEVIVPTLKEWLPEGSYETSKNNVGVEAYWTFPKTGSTIELLTHAQDTKIHEGWKGHIVWADEPLPRDKYTANKRGLVDYRGTFLLTLTALYEPWIMDEIALKNDTSIGKVLEVPITANPLLDVQAIKEFEDALPEEERIARIKGGWLQLVGQVWNHFDMNVHIVDQFEVPCDWAVTALIDFHLALPQAIGFYAFDKQDREWVIDEVWEHGSPEFVANKLIHMKKKHDWNLIDVFIDPLAKGDTAYIKQRGLDIEDTYSVIERLLAPHNMRLHVASKDKTSGVRNVNDRFKGMNNIPSLYIFKKCERHIHEIPRWVRDKDGKPRDENDHMCENLYRSTLTGVKYYPPSMFSGKINNPNKGKGVV
jgi:hypothetical protein